MAMSASDIERLIRITIPSTDQRTDRRSQRCRPVVADRNEFGALGMLPGWWKHRTAAAQLPSADAAAAPVTTPPATTTSQELTALRQHGL